MDAQDRIQVLLRLTDLALGFRGVAHRTLTTLDEVDKKLSAGDVPGARAVIAAFHEGEQAPETTPCMCNVNSAIVRQSVRR